MKTVSAQVILAGGGKIWYHEENGGDPMQYRVDKYGNELSVLGFGCLRFPQKNGKIDMDATRAQIRLAVEQGVNYFDTAYVYGGSEAALGEILESEGLRERVKIATKLPH